jgi:glycosyltransferase involved in cell wall biosynthesis
MHNLPLRVLWLGSVGLRKGIPYLLEAARSLEGTDIRFRVVGSIQIASRFVDSAPRNVTFAGPRPRWDAVQEFEGADVFVLPTISDGFAITQLEAMYHGLPVVTTPNCGDVVTHGIDGFVVRPRDARALAEAFRRLAEDRDLLWRMSNNARSKACQFSLSVVYETFTAELTRCCAASPPPQSQPGHS